MFFFSRQPQICACEEFSPGLCLFGGFLCDHLTQWKSFGDGDGDDVNFICLTFFLCRDTFCQWSTWWGANEKWSAYRFTSSQGIRSRILFFLLSPYLFSRNILLLNWFMDQMDGECFKNQLQAVYVLCNIWQSNVNRRGRRRWWWWL